MADRIEKVRRLVNRAGTDGERVAAEAALARLNAQEVAPTGPRRFILADRRAKGRDEVRTPDDFDPPPAGNRLFYDHEQRGFGLRVTAAGVRSFVLNYHVRGSGRERRITIGQWPAWSVAAARTEASRLRAEVDRGGDPLGKLEEDRAAKTMTDLCDAYIEKHLPKKRASSQKSDRGLIDQFIRPRLGRTTVADLTHVEVDDLHRAITKAGTPYRANRTLALLSKMLSLAKKWGWRTDNPAEGVERNPEEQRVRYLSRDEVARFTAALAAERDQQAADILRILLLTGARSGEVRGMPWTEVDLSSGRWVKPGSRTKQGSIHQVRLNAAACEILRRLRASGGDSRFVFPADTKSGHRGDVQHVWERICKAAGMVAPRPIKVRTTEPRIEEKNTARIHDLRHSFASILASEGFSLKMIGDLLGHSTPATTNRYAHLFDDPQKEAAERVGAFVTGIV